MFQYIFVHTLKFCYELIYIIQNPKNQIKKLLFSRLSGVPMASFAKATACQWPPSLKLRRANVGVAGFEPELNPPKGLVLPLHYTPLKIYLT